MLTAHIFIESMMLLSDSCCYVYEKVSGRDIVLFIARDRNSQVFLIKFQQALYTNSSLNFTYVYAVITKSKDIFFQFFLEQIQNL